MPIPPSMYLDEQGRYTADNHRRRARTVLFFMTLGYEQQHLEPFVGKFINEYGDLCVVEAMQRARQIETLEQEGNSYLLDAIRLIENYLDCWIKWPERHVMPRGQQHCVPLIPHDKDAGKLALAELTLAELLALVDENPRRLKWLGLEILRTQEAISAQRTSICWIVPVGDGPNTGIDINATWSYMLDLDWHGQPNTLVKGRCPLTLEEYFGYAGPLLIDPFTGEGVNTRDPETGNHLGAVPVKILNALHWARVNNRIPDKLRDNPSQIFDGMQSIIVQGLVELHQRAQRTPGYDITTPTGRHHAKHTWATQPEWPLPL